MSRKTILSQAIKQANASPAASDFASLPWKDLRRLASDRGVLRKGMSKEQVLAALEGE